MPWTPPTPPDWVERLNAHGEAVGGAGYLVSLDPDDLLDAARRSHRPRRLRRGHLAAALRRAGRARCSTEAGLTLVGRIVARTELLRALRQRLLLAAPVGRRPDDPRRADRRARVRGGHRPLGHVDPPRAPGARSRPAGRPPPGSCSTRARRYGPRRRPRAAAATRSTPSGPTSSPPTRRCTTTTATSPTSASSPPCSSSSPTSGAAPTRSPPTPPTWSAPTRPRPTGTTAGCCRRCSAGARPRRWVLKAPSHLSQLRTLFAVYPDARVVQIHRDPLKTRAVHHQPDGHDPVDALRGPWTSTPSCPGSRWATP